MTLQTPKFHVLVAILILPLVGRIASADSVSFINRFQSNGTFFNDSNFTPGFNPFALTFKNAGDDADGKAFQNFHAFNFTFDEHVHQDGLFSDFFADHSRNTFSDHFYAGNDTNRWDPSHHWQNEDNHHAFSGEEYAFAPHDWSTPLAPGSHEDHDRSFSQSEWCNDFLRPVTTTSLIADVSRGSTVPVPAAAWSGLSLLAVLGMGAAVHRRHG